jgi:hypothetical protein
MQLQEKLKGGTGKVAADPEPARENDPAGEPRAPTPLPQQQPDGPDLEPAAAAKSRRNSMLADPRLKKQR